MNWSQVVLVLLTGHCRTPTKMNNLRHLVKCDVLKYLLVHIEICDPLSENPHSSHNF